MSGGKPGVGWATAATGGAPGPGMPGCEGKPGGALNGGRGVTGAGPCANGGCPCGVNCGCPWGANGAPGCCQGVGTGAPGGGGMAGRGPDGMGTLIPSCDLIAWI